MATATSNATASLTANGSSTAYGSISWTAPSLPAEATVTGMYVSGKWTWDGKGNVSRVTINGNNTSGGVTFNVALSIGTTSPLRISCVGNKNAVGNSFQWTDLTVTYTYTMPEQMMIKRNETWIEVEKVYVKKNNVWVEQTQLSGLFDTSKNYKQENV